MGRKINGINKEKFRNRPRLGKKWGRVVLKPESAAGIIRRREGDRRTQLVPKKIRR